MPRIDLIPDVYYEPLQPYHVYFDNIPLRNINTKIELVNNAVDVDRYILNDAAGSVGSVANRLNASLNPNGTLKAAAVDAALHSIEEHEDTEDYVRMLQEERDKLALISDSANLLTMIFESASPSMTPVEFNNGTVVLANSISTAWRWEANKLYLDLAYPVESAHQHNYDLTPDTVNYLDYEVPDDYIEGSLRVYVNGTRLTLSGEVYCISRHPDKDVISLTYTIDELDPKKFSLSQALTIHEVVTVDYDVSYIS